MSVWDEVSGQPRAVATLQRAAAAARAGGEDAAFTNSWLITGPPGSGRSNCAYAFAAALLCPNGGCGECDACAQVAARSHPDLMAVATETGIIAIDVVREIVSRSALAPWAAQYRVIVIEDADRVQERTSNTLLKAIEEPIATTVWVLCAPSEADLLPTIRSRVRTVALGTPDAADVAALLVARHGVDAADALRAAQEAQSHIGMAARLVTSPEAWERRSRSLDGVLGLRTAGGAMRKAAEWVDLATADGEAISGDRDARERAELFHSLGLEPGKAVPRQLQSTFRDLEEHQKKRRRRATIDGVDRILTDVQSLWRDVLMEAQGAGVRLVNESRRPEIESAAATMAPQRALDSIAAIGTARDRLALNVPPLLALEELLLGWVSRE